MRGRASGRAFDPARFFARRDTNSDGKLSGDELPERMRNNLSAIDTDGDEAVTLEELQQRMRRFRGGGGEGR